MRLKKIRLVNFKNHSKWEASFDAGWVCITGLNGMGKTNILDGIWYAANSRSYFNPVDKELILHEQPGFSIKAEFEEENSMDVVCRMEAGKRKQIKVNDVPVKKVSQFIGLIPVVMITPFDLSLILEGSEERRRFMDTALCKVYPEYLEALDSYKKALESRNKQLKMFAKKGFKDLILLESFDNILTQAAPILFGFRKKFAEEISGYFNPIYQKVSEKKEEVSVSYISHLSEKDMQTWLLTQLEKDLILERTTKGTHQDDLLFLIGKFAVKKFGSQGQSKSFVVALQLALFQWLRGHKGIAPLLLLDDIYEKIDAERASALMQVIDELKPEQVFVTDTHKERVEANLESVSMPKSFLEL